MILLRAPAAVSSLLSGYTPELVLAYDTTERTTTATASTDLVSLSLRIPIGERMPFQFQGRLRKSAGAAAGVLLGLKINGTQVISNFLVTSATNQAESGAFAIGDVFARHGSYAGIGPLMTSMIAPAAGTTTAFTNTAYATGVPAPPITSVVITGRTNSSLITLGVRDVSVTAVRLP